MSTFDKREQGFESKFARDNELAFKIHARRNKLIGLWAAEKIGRQGADAEAYAKEVIKADFEEAGDDDIIRKLLKDLNDALIQMTEKQLRAELDRFTAIAREQLGGNS